MKKGFYISKAAAVACLVIATAAAAVIIALSAVYSQEKSKSQAARYTTSGPGGPATSEPPSMPSTPKEPWHRYRLPDALRPVSYNVSLWPRLQPNRDEVYVFTGNSSVVFRCVKETDLILIHSNKLNLTMLEGHHAVLRGLDGAPTPSLRRTWLELPTQYLVVQLSGLLAAGGRYQLYTQFVGELADDLAGFYRSEYTIGGERKVLAVSQLQATDARKVFPCFDEPALKAVFHITLIHPPGTVALSNSMSYEPLNITMDGQELLQTSYEPTKLMSTYTLAVAVCDFGFRGTRLADNTLIRVWARKNAIEAGHGDYALEKTGPILAFFEDYYNSSYPLSKSDQIAVPDFSAGGMENWGLVMYSEPALLYNPIVSADEDKVWVALIISHELAHMWFGNLVTMRWWNDLWLNEAFATYIAYLGSNYSEPEWGLPDMMVLNDIINVMGVDARASSHPLSSKEDDIQTPDDIMKQFDSITYSKGAAVLRMLSDFITEEAFSAGLRTYLKEFEYNSTTYTDLWKHLQMAVEQAGVKLPCSVDAIMNRWILQMGFPVVTIDTQTGSISQQQFLFDGDSAVVTPSEFNYTWFVPIKWIKNGAAQQRFWLLEAEKTNPDMVLDSSGWLLANVDMKGFYRVNYDSGNWERLLATLTSRPQDIPLINRVQLMDDAFNLVRAKMVNITLALGTTRFLEKEHEYMPWLTARKHLRYMLHIFDQSEVFGPLQAYLKRLVTPLFNYFRKVTANWTKSPDKRTDLYNLENAIWLSCSAGVPGCEDLTAGWFREWMRNPDNNTLNPNLRATVYCHAIASGGVEEWDFAWSMFKNSSLASEAGKLQYGLSCTRRPWLLNRYLHYCLDADKIRKEDAISAITSISDNAVGRPLAWNFVRAKWDDIVTYSGGLLSLTGLINGLTRRFSTKFDYQQLLQFKEDRAEPPGVAAVDLEQALERVKTNMNWVSQNKEQVMDWFSREVSSD